MSAMQDFYIAPISVDAFVAQARAERSEALARMIRKAPAKLRRFTAQLLASVQVPPASKAA